MKHSGRAEPLAPAIAATVELEVIAAVVIEPSTGYVPAMKIATLFGNS